MMPWNMFELEFDENPDLRIKEIDGQHQLHIPKLPLQMRLECPTCHSKIRCATKEVVMSRPFVIPRDAANIDLTLRDSDAALPKIHLRERKRKKTSGLSMKRAIIPEGAVIIDLTRERIAVPGGPWKRRRIG
ncbi:hypothetical protein FALBO_10023 [Fusarium albosuccineum]|uniref:Uncharacterized protein n=1 Tax=Fusarium albosuccineum TaxID=1237068 RepID=A0A8H4L7T6_9HYPO|nr:hypothetical protein FALBO_10023 [Fusarium albosuccineum]